ncbi:hypothetical protein ACFQJC_02850 [Haloferax namakaokahaiae]|uniref:Cardiolipin synthase N-terminal domain-containing protein n=1 Tax=Haloferax namakaokahaiae TaxID=1748331 RepID=A0ABD5ZBS5_9EURY
MNGLLVFIAMLWLVLAIAVAFHANGQGRSGLFWFIVVFILGIFGVVFYLLAITGGSSEESTGEVPGSGPTARSFERRVRNQQTLFFAVEEHLRNHGVVTKTGLQNTVFPEHPVGYETESDWWDDFVLPELEEREKFERVDGIENGWKLASNG